MSSVHLQTKGTNGPLTTLTGRRIDIMNLKTTTGTHNNGPSDRNYPVLQNNGTLSILLLHIETLWTGTVSPHDTFLYGLCYYEVLYCVLFNRSSLRVFSISVIFFLSLSPRRPNHWCSSTTLPHRTVPPVPSRHVGSRGVWNGTHRGGKPTRTQLRQSYSTNTKGLYQCRHTHCYGGPQRSGVESSVEVGKLEGL